MSSAFVYRHAPCRLAIPQVTARRGPHYGHTDPQRLLVPFSLLRAGPLPPTPPPRVAAALKGGLLPCLETLLRRAATEPDGPHSRLIAEAFQGPQSVWPYLGWLLSYGDVRQGASLVATLRKLPVQLDGAVDSTITGSLSFHGPPPPPQSQANAFSVLFAVLDGTGEVLFGGGSNSGRRASIYAQEAVVAAVQAGRPRLQLLSAYAVCQLLPPLADYARAATCRALGLMDKPLGRAAKAIMRASVASAMHKLRVFHSWGCVCRCVWALAASSLGDRAVAQAAAGAGCSSSGSCSCSSAGGGGGGGAGGGGDGSGGSAAAGAANGSLYRYPWCGELLEDLGVVELLGTALRLVAAITPRSSAEVKYVAGPLLRYMAGALVAVAAAVPEKLQLVATAAARSGGGSKRPATAAKAKATAAAPAAGGEAGTWPPELVRELSNMLDVSREELLADALKLLADLLERWGQGSGAKVEAGEAERDGEALEKYRAAARRAFGLVEGQAGSEVGAGENGWDGESLREVRGLLRTCSNPRCANLDGDSEAAVEGGLVACVHGCGLARYCGKVCMAAHRKAGHAAVCAVGVAGSGARK